MRKVIQPADHPSGLLTVDTETDAHYWGNNRIYPCTSCNKVVINVDDCGNFGDPDCPQFGRNRHNAKPEGT